MGVLRGLTFEVSWRQRQDARPRTAKMYTVLPAGAWWPAVGAQLDRGVRPHLAEVEHAEHSVLVLRQPIADGVVVAFVRHEDVAFKAYSSLAVERTKSNGSPVSEDWLPE